MSKKCDEKCADTKDKSNNGSFLVFYKKTRAKQTTLQPNLVTIVFHNKF